MEISICYLGDKYSSKVILIVGGSGDTKDSYGGFVNMLTEILPKYKIITFSFQGQEDEKDLPLQQQVEDLKHVLSTLHNLAIRSITILGTSMGAFSVTHVLNNEQFSEDIKEVVLLDPADYYLDTLETAKKITSWTGVDNYAPSRPTAVSLMNKIKSNTRIHVINFTIRNYDGAGYTSEELRGIDNSNQYARLNNDMVKTFYDNTPIKNRGKYIEDNTIPHAFMRDGNVKNNIDRLAQILKKCLDR
jgi:predicted alpha/beta-fold hydrolase